MWYSQGGEGRISASAQSVVPTHMGYEWPYRVVPHVRGCVSKRRSSRFMPSAVPSCGEDRTGVTSPRRADHHRDGCQSCWVRLGRRAGPAVAAAVVGPAPSRHPRHSGECPPIQPLPTEHLSMPQHWKTLGPTSGALWVAIPAIVQSTMASLLRSCRTLAVCSVQGSYRSGTSSLTRSASRPPKRRKTGCVASSLMKSIRIPA